MARIAKHFEILKTIGIIGIRKFSQRGLMMYKQFIPISFPTALTSIVCTVESLLFRVIYRITITSFRIGVFCACMASQFAIALSSTRDFMFGRIITPNGDHLATYHTWHRFLAFSSLPSLLANPFRSARITAKASPLRNRRLDRELFPAPFTGKAYWHISSHLSIIISPLRRKSQDGRNTGI